MRTNLEFFYYPTQNDQLYRSEFLVLNSDFSNKFKIKDKEIINKNWKEARSRNPQIFSERGGLAILYDTTEIQKGKITCLRTEFKDYLAVSKTYDRKLLRSDIYDNFRIAAVGLALECADGKVLVHRRSKKASHAAGFIDSSCAGLCFVDLKGKKRIIDPFTSIYEKAQRELNLQYYEITNLELVAIHSSSYPDFSGMCDFSAKTNLKSTELESRIKKGTFEEFEFVKKDKLLDYVVEHYVSKQDMLGDGAATLLSSLGGHLFLEGIRRISTSGKEIKFGALSKGKFIPHNV